MESDRYEHHPLIYVLGMVCLLSSVSLILFSFYLLPYLLWNLNYDVPGFIHYWYEAIRETFDLRYATTRLLVFLSFFIPGLLAGAGAYWASNQIEDELVMEPYETPPPPSHLKEEVKASLSFGSWVLLLVVLVFVGVGCMEWLIFG